MGKSLTVVSSPKTKDLKALREQLGGPVKVYLNSDRKDENGELVMEVYVNEAGEEDQRPERDAEPFLEEVYYRKNYMTPKMEKRMKELRESKEFEELPLTMSTNTVEMMIAKWDLTNDGKPVGTTSKEIIENDVPSALIYAVLNACYEDNRPPKALSDRSQNTSSQEE